MPDTTQTSGALQDQKAVNYRTAGDGTDSCAACQHFQAPAACALVKPPINPGGLCDLYTPVGDTMPPAARPGLEDMMLGGPPMVPGLPGVV